MLYRDEEGKTSVHDAFMLIQRQNQNRVWYDGRKILHAHFIEDDLLSYDKFPKEKLVYLSPDAGEVLQDIEDDKIYVIGGLVDRSV